MPAPPPTQKVKHVVHLCISKYNVSSKSCYSSTSLVLLSWDLSDVAPWRRRGFFSILFTCKYSTRKFAVYVYYSPGHIKSNWAINSHSSSNNSFQTHFHAYFSKPVCSVESTCLGESTLHDYSFIGEFIFHELHFPFLRLKKLFAERFKIDYTILLRKDSTQQFNVWEGFDVRCMGRWMK